MNGWEAESDAATLLNGLGIDTEFHYAQMADLTGSMKVKVLLAQALFGNPDILLLDEPTNHLDLPAIEWLEEFLINFDNTVIVVSHDRYFLNKVCTQTADIDYGKIQLYAGNYDFWYESSQLLIKQMKEANKKKEEKIKELQEFISRFSANASKSKQATSRKRALEKIQLDDMRPSSRKYPYIDFRPNREIGNEVLMVENLSKTIDGVKVLDDISFTLGREDKVAFVGANEQAITTFFKILTGEMEPDEGNYKCGVTTSQAYFPKDNTQEFDNDLTITDWLTQYSEIKDATYVRGFLGRMLFPGEDGVKRVRVLSGGEKVRCLLSKMMISGANILILDEPTNHLDMESITALNNGLIKFPGVILFTSHDHQFVQTTANRIMEILPNGTMIDKITPRPSEQIADDLEALGVEKMQPVITGKKTYIAPFVNAEKPQYLVIEDSFPNGRPALEKGFGVYMADRNTVNLSERMKVTVCLNPVHSVTGPLGVVLGYDLFAHMLNTNEDMMKMARMVAYDEGLPVVADPGILSPQEFVDELFNDRFPNEYLGDTNLRLAVDVSQMVGIRFGETVKAYVAKYGDASKLTAIPLGIAGWLRYMLAVDDEGNKFELAPDPMNEEIGEQLGDIVVGKPETLKDQLKPILSNERLFFTDLYKDGVGEKIEEMFREMIAGPGAVKATIHKYVH